MNSGRTDITVSEDVQTKTESDCQPCRYIGTSLFLFTAAYIWYHTSGQAYSGSIYKRLPLRLVAIGSVYMSIARYIYLPPFQHLAPNKKKPN